MSTKRQKLVVCPSSNRRGLLLAGARVVVSAVLPRAGGSGAAAESPAGVLIETFTPAGVTEGISRVSKIVKTDAQWQQQLPANAFVVTRHAGTEPAFTGSLWNNHL